MKCFYHSGDLDGQASGAIVKAAYPWCELVGINYDDPFPWDTITPGEHVWVVDFCLQPFSDMARLNVRAQLTWIDHHKTSLEHVAETGFQASERQVLDVEQAACELTWDVCYPKRPMPLSVRYLGRYDVWKHAEWAHALPFQYGMRFESDTRPDNYDLWKVVLWDEDYVMDTVKLGETLLEYERRQNLKYAKSCAFDVTLDGLRCVAINKGLTNSLAFVSVYDPAKHDAMLSFVRRDGRWTISLYADKPEVDVSDVCKARGGGGHKGAAGFSCDVLPF